MTMKLSQTGPSVKTVSFIYKTWLSPPIFQHTVYVVIDIGMFINERSVLYSFVGGTTVQQLETGFLDVSEGLIRGKLALEMYF
jgi:hypothetical protein